MPEDSRQAGALEIEITPEICRINAKRVYAAMEIKRRESLRLEPAGPAP